MNQAQWSVCLEGCFSPQFKALDLNLWTKARTQKHGGMVSSVKGDKKDQYFSILKKCNICS